MHKLLQFSTFFLLFTFSIFATPIHYAPIDMGGITTFVPYSHVKVSLGNDKFMKEGEDVVLSLKLSHLNDVISYIWREGNRVINTKSTLSLKSFPIGTHNITVSVIDINGLQTIDSIKVVIGSKEYIGKRTKVLLNSDNYIKFVRAINLIEHIKFKHFLSCYGEGVSAINHIDDSTKIGYIVQNFTNYDYGAFEFYGKQNIRLNGYYRFDKYENTYKTDTDLTFISNENNITIKAKMHTIDNNGTQKEYIDKYYIYDEKYHENIEILDINTEHPKLYIGSEGYVTIDATNDNFLVYGKHNTELSVIFKQENSIYETRALDIEPDITHQVQIYSQKRGQGSIDTVLNGLTQEKLYYIPYQVSSFEPIKFYESNNEPEILEYAFYSWYINYKLLNYNKNDIDISIEWFVNNIKVDTPFSYELPLNSYSENDTIKVVLNVHYGDISTKIEQSLTAEENNYRNASGKYEYPEDTYNIVYRTNDKIFNLNLLKHEYFDNIDIENSDFSWTIFYGFNPGLEGFSIDHKTQYEKIPRVTNKEYRYGYRGEIYLKIYTNNKIKVVRFNITLEKGSTGINNIPNIIESINEANITNNSEYITTHKVQHVDIDKNGLDDIIYISETTNGNFLNISYQDSKRVFDLEKIAINGGIYLGDFDGDTTIEALAFSNDLNETKIISLNRGNIHKIKDINLSSTMNILDIKAVADMNNDGRDDLIIANNQEKKLYIYDDINNTLDKRLIGSNECIKILSIVDVNNDGLKDIICAPSDSLKYLYSENGEDYFSSNLIIKAYLQDIDNSFTLVTRKYALINNASYHEVNGMSVYSGVMLNNSMMAISLKDKDGDILYTCDLNNDSNKPQSKTLTNAYQIAAFFTPIDIDHDGLSDLISFNSYGSGKLNIFNQKQNFEFESDYSVNIDSYYQLTDSLLRNAFLYDIDNDGSSEIVTVNGENKFSYINFK